MPEQKPEPNTSHQEDFAEPKKSSTGKTILFVVIAIVVIVAAAGGTYYYMNKKIADQKKAQQAQIDALNAKVAELQKSQVVENKTTEETASPTIYKNIKYSYQLEVPNGWDYEEIQSGILNLYVDKNSPLKGEGTVNASIGYSDFGHGTPGPLTSRTTVVINGIQMEKSVYEGGDPSRKLVTYKFNKNNIYYAIEYVGNSSDQESFTAFEQMVNTFKLTD
ncbi:MAG: hypothetical protein QG675_315 [Patescibacteria group bacterium]|nr:hypothetical protein [Patescibacteria group bacterium]